MERNAVYGPQRRIEYEKCGEFSYRGTTRIDYNRSKFRSF